MKEGDKVLVPRTSGDFTPGTIVFIHGEKALVEFPIGLTFKGKPAPTEYQNEIGMKVVDVDKLCPLEEENEMQEIVAVITSTEMPDGKYPVFRLLKIEDKCCAQFVWRHIDVVTVGFNEEDVIFEAAEAFTIFIEDFLDEILGIGGSL